LPDTTEPRELQGPKTGTMAQLMTNAALDRIAERFGSNAITTADLTESKRRRG